jgi:hypothetical protein
LVYDYSTNNVGIGTAGPGDKLTIQGGALSFNNPSNPVPYVGIDYDSSGDDLRFRANIGAAALNTTHMVIDRTTGNVGIGTTTPRSLLQIADTRPQLTLTDTSAGLNNKHWYLSSQGGNFYVGTSTDALNATSTYLTINQAGNVGIGTAGPVGKLDVSGGKIRLTSSDISHGMTGLAPTNVGGEIYTETSSTGGGLELRGYSDYGYQNAMIFRAVQVNNPNPTYITAFQLQGSMSNGLFNQALRDTDNVLQIDNYSTHLITVLGNGNVGIGTTGPGAKLEVQGSTNIGNANISYSELSVGGAGDSYNYGIFGLRAYGKTPSSVDDPYR